MRRTLSVLSDIIQCIFKTKSVAPYINIVTHYLQIAKFYKTISILENFRTNALKEPGFVRIRTRNVWRPTN